MKRLFEQLDALSQRPVSWLSDEGGALGIALSCRLRLARNLTGVPFPARASLEQRRQVQLRVAKALSRVPSLSSGIQADLSMLRELDLDLLRERRLIDAEAEASEGLAVCIARDESACLAINETDHLRLWLFQPGPDLRILWHQADRLDSLLGQGLDFVFDPKLGFLTARPGDLGTGIRAGVLLHLPGLVLAGYLEQVTAGLQQMGLSLEPIYASGERPVGNFFEVANESCLGESEKAIVARLATVVSDLVVQEQHARQVLLEKHPEVILDLVGRAYGSLRYGYRLTTGEAVGLFSALRLGVDLGLLETVDIPTLNQLLLTTQPAHLQKHLGERLNDNDRDVARASLVRDRLERASRGATG